MDITVQTKPGLVLIGALHQGGNANNAIPALWQSQTPRLQALPSADPGVFYGAIDHFNPDTGTFDYIASVPVAADTAVAEGLVRWELPAQAYAVVPCTLATIRAAMDTFYKDWLPASSYQRSGGAELEYYPATFEATPESAMELWFPITPRA